MDDQRNLILAFVLSIAILLAFEYFYSGPQRKYAEQQAARQAEHSHSRAWINQPSA